jgi:hypothetical protein
MFLEKSPIRQRMFPEKSVWMSPEELKQDMNNQELLKHVNNLTESLKKVRKAMFERELSDRKLISGLKNSLLTAKQSMRFNEMNSKSEIEKYQNHIILLEKLKYDDESKLKKVGMCDVLNCYKVYVLQLLS